MNDHVCGSGRVEQNQFYSQIDSNRQKLICIWYHFNYSNRYPLPLPTTLSPGRREVSKSCDACRPCGVCDMDWRIENDLIERKDDFHGHPAVVRKCLPELLQRPMQRHPPSLDSLPLTFWPDLQLDHSFREPCLHDFPGTPSSSLPFTKLAFMSFPDAVEIFICDPVLLKVENSRFWAQVHYAPF